MTSGSGEVWQEYGKSMAKVWQSMAEYGRACELIGADDTIGGECM